MESCRSPGHPASGGITVLGVADVSSIIAELLDDARLDRIWVRGEVTNYRNHSSGHRYFSLSEQSAFGASVINCAMWRTSARSLDFTPGNGMDVIVHGSVEVYEPHGKYQLIVREMYRAGTGEKHLLVEEWKRQLAQEGLFAPERKRPLPKFPTCIGVVTSPTGAALQDIVNVIGRRYPVEILVSPTAVQGEEAHIEIARAIQKIDGRVDLIIVGRGGGSFEDLFAFNHPDVVRAIAACTTPVISAVGHDTDVSLSDFAADLCAPTPSAAAERAVPDRSDLLRDLREQAGRIHALMARRLADARRDLGDLAGRMQPRRLLRRLDERMAHLADLEEQMRRGADAYFLQRRLHLAEVAARLEGKNPIALMERGYCVAQKDRRVVRSMREIAPRDRITLYMKDGRSNVVVEDVVYDGDV